MDMHNTGKTCRYKIAKYAVFAEKFLKKKAKPLWDQSKKYTKEERDKALSWLSKALKVDIGTRVMLQFVLRFKKMQEKRLRGYLVQAIHQKIPPELSLYKAKIPHWVRNVETKLQMMPKLIEEYAVTGVLQEDKKQTLWSNILQLLLTECHKHQRIPILEDVKVVAAQVNIKKNQLLYRLWMRQKDITLYKFRMLYDACDVPRDAPLALTQLEWKVMDVMLLYLRHISLACLNKNLSPLVTLYHLVTTYKIEENNGVDVKEKWARVVLEYSKKHMTSPSGIVLQRRWWEIKQQAHYNIRERMRTVEYKVHPMLVEIATNYPYIVTEGLDTWQDMVKNGKVYDVSMIQPDDSSDDEDDMDEGVSAMCQSKGSYIIDVDSDFDSEDDQPLVIDEKIAKKHTLDFSMLDLNSTDKETFEEKSTVTQNPDDTPVTVNEKPINLEDKNTPEEEQTLVIDEKIAKEHTLDSSKPDLNSTDKETSEEKSTETQIPDDAPVTVNKEQINLKDKNTPEEEQTLVIDEKIANEHTLDISMPDLNSTDKETSEEKSTETQIPDDTSVTVNKQHIKLKDKNAIDEQNTETQNSVETAVTKEQINLKDKNTPEEKSAEPKNPHYTSVTTNKEQINDPNVTDANISTSSLEEIRRMQINWLNSQLDYIENEDNSEGTVCENKDSNSTDNIIECNSVGSGGESNNAGKSNESNSTDSVTKSNIADDDHSTDNIAENKTEETEIEINDSPKDDNDINQTDNTKESHSAGNVIEGNLESEMENHNRPEDNESNGTYNETESTDGYLAEDLAESNLKITGDDNEIREHNIDRNLKGNVAQGQDINPTDNKIDPDDSTPKDNPKEINNSCSNDNLTKTNDMDMTDKINVGVINAPISKSPILSNNSILTNNIRNPPDYRVKTYSKAKPVINLSTGLSLTGIESDLQKLELEFQMQMRYMFQLRDFGAHHEKRKPFAKKVGDKIRNDIRDPLKADSAAKKTVSSNKVNKSKFENRKPLAKTDDDKIRNEVRDPLKANPTAKKTDSSNKVNKSELTNNKNLKSNKKSVNKKTNGKSAKSKGKSSKTNTDLTANMDIDEGNLAAQSLIKSMNTDIATETKDNSIIPTVYACKGPDGKELGHVILPAPISKDAVTVSIKTDNGTLSLDSAVVNDLKKPLSEPINPFIKTIRLKEILPHGMEITKTSNESIEPLSEAKESDIDLLQKIDPAQAETVIIFSDSEDDNENIAISDTNLVNVSNVSDIHQGIVPDISNTNQKNIQNASGRKDDNINLDDVKKFLNNHSLDDILTRMGDMVVKDNKQENIQNISGQKEDNINLDDVKKYLNNHSLDDILTRMGDMVIKKEVKKTEKESGNRICESFIYVSDSDDDDILNNAELDNNDVSVNNVNNKTKKDSDQSFEMLGCRSNDCTMIANDSNKSIVTNNAKKVTEGVTVKTEDVFNTPNANVFILPPNFFQSTLRTTIDPSPTSNTLIPPMIQCPSNIPIPPNVESSPSNVLPTSLVPNITPNVVPISTILNYKSNISNPIIATQIPPPLVLSRTPNIKRPISKDFSSTTAAETSTSNVKIQTPNSNVVTMIINDQIGNDCDTKNIYDDVMSVNGDYTINKNVNSKTYNNKSSVLKPRRTKIYNETEGYAGLFQLKDRSTQETVGMLCKIKEEKRLVSEVTEKIENYLEKFNDSEDKIDKRNEFLDIINKKLEIEHKMKSSDGFLKKMLDNSQTKTLWTGKNKEKSDEIKADKETGKVTIDPKLIMDARVYLPKLDEVETYNKNRRVDFSINTRRISKIGYKILNHKMKSDDPELITDNTVLTSNAPITEHIETEIAVAFKNKIPVEELKEMLEVNSSKNSRRRKKSIKQLVDLRTEELDNLTKRIKKEREIQQSISPDGTSVLVGGNVTEKFNDLTEKIRSERQKQQLLDNNATKIVQRIKFEADENLNTNDDIIDTNIPGNNGGNTIFENNDIDDKNITEDSQIQQVPQKTIQQTNDGSIDFNGDDMYDSEGSGDMELETECNNTLILDSSNALTNKPEKETNVAEANAPQIFESHEEILTNKLVDENINIAVNSKPIAKDNISDITSTNKDVNTEIRICVKVETIEKETRNVSNVISSDNEDLPIKIPQKVKKRLISSVEDGNEEKSKSDKSGFEVNESQKRPKTVKNRLLSGDEDEESSKSDEDLGLRIENKLLKEDSAKDLLQVEDGLLKVIGSTENMPVRKSNIEEMLKLCKPVRLCLERVQVPKDIDTQVRKVELPDRSSLKRHRAPTAHVAPINVRTREDDDNEGGAAEINTDGDATETDIGNLLQQLTKETACEWQRLKEESIKTKRPKISDAEHRRKKDETAVESQRLKEESVKTKKPRVSDAEHRRKKDEKKQQPQKVSDDEIDATLEWQRQKNINYKFFNFNPISKTMEPDPNNSRRSKKNAKSNKKLDLLVKKVVIDDTSMQQNNDIIDLDDNNDESNDKRTKTDTQAAVESISNDMNTNIQLNKNSNMETIESTAKGSKLSKVPTSEPDIKLTPIFTKIEPQFVKTASKLIPIATKVELTNEELPKRSVVKKYHSSKVKNFVQSLPKKENSNTLYDQPSTSKASDISNPIPSTSKSQDLGLICISDDSNDVFELTHTISVKNSENNVNNNEKSTQSVSLKDLMKKHKMNKKHFQPTKIAPRPIITVSPAANTSLLGKVPNSTTLRNNKDSNHPVKLMGRESISSDASSLKFVTNETPVNEDNDQNCPQITNVRSIPNIIDLDNDSNDGLKIDENAIADYNKKEIETNQSAPRIETVMSIEHIGRKRYKDSVEEKSENEMGFIIQNVRSIPKDIDNDINEQDVDYNGPANSNDEHYDSDSDNLQINESFSTDLVEAKLSTSKDLDSNNMNIEALKPTAKENVNTLSKYDKSKSSKNSIEIPKLRSIIVNRSSMQSKANKFLEKKDYYDSRESAMNNYEGMSETSNNNDDSNTINDLFSNNDNNDKNLHKSITDSKKGDSNDAKMKVDETGHSKIGEKNCLNLCTDERRDTKTKNSKESNPKSKENRQSSTSTDSKTTEKNEPQLEKPRSFLTVVPIQKLRGEPLVTTESNKDIDKEEENRLRGQPIPFQCLSDDENTSVGGSMPIISDVVSLSSVQSTPTVNFIKSKLNDPPNTWKADYPHASIEKRLDFSKVSSSKPLTVTEFIKDRDCTNISLLCLDEYRPLWTIIGDGEYFVLTHLKLPVISPTYWWASPQSECTRIIMDNTVSGRRSAMVGALSVPDEVFLDNNWYKKLSSDPMIYAKIWYVVPDLQTHKAMMNAHVRLHLYSRSTGAILPLVVLTETSPPKITHYRINTKNLNPLQIPGLATMVTSPQTNKQSRLVVDGTLGLKDIIPKPVPKPITSDEVISLDSDDE